MDDRDGKTIGEKKMENFNEQNQRDYNSALARLNTAKSNINNGEQTSAGFVALSAELDSIAQAFRSLPSTNVVKAQIEVCENYRKLCEENRINRQNEEYVQNHRSALDKLNTAKQKIKTHNQKTEYFTELSNEFVAIEQVFRSLPSPFDVKAQIEECLNCRKLCEEKRQRKAEAELRKKETKKTVFSVSFWGLFIAIILLLQFVAIQHTGPLVDIHEHSTLIIVFNIGLMIIGAIVVGAIGDGCLLAIVGGIGGLLLGLLLVTLLTEDYGRPFFFIVLGIILAIPTAFLYKYMVKKYQNEED
jgi:uncharacterized membrane protein